MQIFVDPQVVVTAERLKTKTTTPAQDERPVAAHPPNEETGRAAAGPREVAKPTASRRNQRPRASSGGGAKATGEGLQESGDLPVSARGLLGRAVCFQSRRRGSAVLGPQPVPFGCFAGCIGVVSDRCRRVSGFWERKTSIDVKEFGSQRCEDIAAGNGDLQAVWARPLRWTWN